MDPAKQWYDEFLRGVDFQTENYGIAVGNNGTFLETRDGENWAKDLTVQQLIFMT
ncbi:MAG: hypothetical protein U5K00_01150 [Melioribacteraceae bacterium]|nr:hypothetical protein [Melioribacteraceae bacterium]